MPSSSDILTGTACRLYFDIEYKLAINNGTPAIPVLDTFIQVLNITE